jgi:hypothetical protein
VYEPWPVHLQMNGRDRMNLTLRQKAQPMLSDARMPRIAGITAPVPTMPRTGALQRCSTVAYAAMLSARSAMNPAVALHRTHTPLGAGFIGFLYVRRQMAAKSASAALTRSSACQQLGLERSECDEAARLTQPPSKQLWMPGTCCTQRHPHRRLMPSSTYTNARRRLS